MTTNDLEFKSVENKEDIDSTISFLQNLISHEIDNEIWEWEFNSFSDDTVLTIIKDKKGTVGTQFMLPIPLTIGERDLLSGKCENSYFANEYRGLGLFQKLFTQAEELSLKKSFEFLWAFTPATKVYEKKLSFTVFEDVMFNFSAQVGKPQMSFIKGFTSNKVKIYAKYFYMMLKFLRYKARVNSFSKKIGYSELLSKYDVRDSLASFEKVDVLYRTQRLQKGNFAHVKFDATYFHWRISNNINLKYITRYFFKADVLEGYYILALKDNSANLTDFTSLNDDTSNVMIIHLLKEISNLQVQQLNYFGNIENELNRKNFDLLKKFGGVITVNTGMPFVFKNISGQNSDYSFLNQSRNWYLNGMWTEGFSY